MIQFEILFPDHLLPSWTVDHAYSKASKAACKLHRQGITTRLEHFKTIARLRLESNKRFGFDWWGEVYPGFADIEEASDPTDVLIEAYMDKY